MICTCPPSETDTLAGADPACPYHHPAGAERGGQQVRSWTFDEEHVVSDAPKESAQHNAEGAAPLDIDAMAQILKKGNIGCEDHRDRQGGYHLASAHKEDAEFIAAEYARLSRPSDERVPEEGQ